MHDLLLTLWVTVIIVSTMWCLLGLIWIHSEYYGSNKLVRVRTNAPVWFWLWAGNTVIAIGHAIWLLTLFVMYLARSNH